MAFSAARSARKVMADAPSDLARGSITSCTSKVNRHAAGRRLQVTTTTGASYHAARRPGVGRQRIGRPRNSVATAKPDER